MAKPKPTKPRVGELVPQEHGGALRNGGTNKGGPGAPPSVVRARARQSFYDRINILERIADKEGSVDQQLSAIDKLGKYGLSGGVSADDVRERLKLTLNEIRAALPADQASMLVERIKQHWVSA